MTTTPRRPSSALGLLLILVGLVPIACSSGDATARTATIEFDTIGDTIVARVHGAPLWGDSVALVEEVRIGELEGPEEYTFGTVVSMAVDSAGTMYVLDQSPWGR